MFTITIMNTNDNMVRKRKQQFRTLERDFRKYDTDENILTKKDSYIASIGYLLKNILLNLKSNLWNNLSDLSLYLVKISILLNMAMIRKKQEDRRSRNKKLEHKEDMMLMSLLISNFGTIKSLSPLETKDEISKLIKVVDA